MGAVLALRGASAIDEERQSVNIGNSTHRQKGQSEDNGKQPYDEQRGRIPKREWEKALTRNSVVHFHDDFPLLSWLGSRRQCPSMLMTMATSCF